MEPQLVRSRARVEKRSVQRVGRSGEVAARRELLRGGPRVAPHRAALRLPGAARNSERNTRAPEMEPARDCGRGEKAKPDDHGPEQRRRFVQRVEPVSYTHLRA